MKRYWNLEDIGGIGRYSGGGHAGFKHVFEIYSPQIEICLITIATPNTEF
jgi:hypothetical protein